MPMERTWGTAQSLGKCNALARARGRLLMAASSVVKCGVAVGGGWFALPDRLSRR